MNGFLGVRIKLNKQAVINTGVTEEDWNTEDVSGFNNKAKRNKLNEA